MCVFSVTDYNQWRLVKSKMYSIFKPNMRWSLNTNASDSFQGIFGGEDPENVCPGPVTGWNQEFDFKSTGTSPGTGGISIIT